MKEQSLLSDELIAEFWSNTEWHGKHRMWTGAMSGKYGSWKGVAAHRMAWIIQNGQIPPGKIIKHECDIKLCMSCIELGTSGQNNKEAYDRGLKIAVPKFGEENPNALCNTREILEIRALQGKTSQRKIAAEYGISKTTVAKIWSRELWSHIE